MGCGKIAQVQPLPPVEIHISLTYVMVGAPAPFLGSALLWLPSFSSYLLLPGWASKARMEARLPFLLTPKFLLLTPFGLAFSLVYSGEGSPPLSFLIGRGQYGTPHKPEDDPPSLGPLHLDV